MTRSFTDWVISPTVFKSTNATEKKQWSKSFRRTDYPLANIWVHITYSHAHGSIVSKGSQGEMLSYVHESNYNPTQAFPVAVLSLARVGYIIDILLPAAFWTVPQPCLFVSSQTHWTPLIHWLFRSCLFVQALCNQRPRGHHRDAGRPGPSPWQMCRAVEHCRTLFHH